MLWQALASSTKPGICFIRLLGGTTKAGIPGMQIGHIIRIEKWHQAEKGGVPADRPAAHLSIDKVPIQGYLDLLGPVSVAERGLSSSKREARRNGGYIHPILPPGHANTLM